MNIDEGTYMNSRLETVIICIPTYLGTIPKLRQHIFGLFLTYPVIHPPYVSINSTEHQQIDIFLNPPTQSLC